MSAQQIHRKGEIDGLLLPSNGGAVGIRLWRGL